jgi:hypothetical protein
MANEQKTRQHHPDTKRDFETGTVNPGPGMAGPLSDQDQNPTANQGGNQAPKGQSNQAQKGQAAKQSDQGSCGSCGCG